MAMYWYSGSAWKDTTDLWVWDGSWKAVQKCWIWDGSWKLTFDSLPAITLTSVDVTDASGVCDASGPSNILLTFDQLWGNYGIDLTFSYSFNGSTYATFVPIELSVGDYTYEAYYDFSGVGGFSSLNSTYINVEAKIAGNHITNSPTTTTPPYSC